MVPDLCLVLNHLLFIVFSFASTGILRGISDPHLFNLSSLRHLRGDILITKTQEVIVLLSRVLRSETRGKLATFD